MSSVPNHLYNIIFFDKLPIENSVIYTSEGFNTNTTICYSIEVSWTASLGRTGIFEIQGTNVNEAVDDDWKTMIKHRITEDKCGLLINFEMISVGFVRVRYTSVTGEGGTLSVNLNSKQR